MAPRQRFEVTEDLAGERVDLAVSRLAELPRSTVAALFVEGGVERDDAMPLRRSDKVEAGDALWVDIPEPSPGLQPVAMNLELLFENNDMAVLDKPSGLVTHPGAGTSIPTLAAGVLARWPQVEGVGEEHRWGLVHRLDKETSGALLVAKTTAAYESLTEQLRVRTIGRRYRALCHGLFEFGTGTIDAPIARDRRYPTRFTVESSGRPARTHYERMERSPEFDVTMAQVRLETGRTHQIRVHLASIGHPVVGDPSYGGAGPDEVDPGRVWLHAEHLRFVDLEGSEHEITSPLPVELRESLARLGSSFWADQPTD